MDTRRRQRLAAIVAALALAFTGMVGLSSPSSAAIDCDLHPESPLCEGGPIDPCELNPGAPGCGTPCVVVNTTRPEITETTQVGAILLSTNNDVGQWTGADSFHYQWLVDGEPTWTGTTFTPQPSDRGRKIALEVTGRAACGAARVVTSAEREIDYGYQSSTLVEQSLTGLPATVGVPLHVKAATTRGIGEVTVSFEWKVGSTVLAQGPDYTPRPADVGKRVVVVGHYERVGYHRLDITNVPVKDVQAAPTGNPGDTPSDPGPGPGTGPGSGGTDPTPDDAAGQVVTTDPSPVTSASASPALLRAPRVLGAARFGALLTVSPAAWDRTGRIHRQWLRNGAPIRGATGATYRPVLADIGKSVSVQETNTVSGQSPVLSRSPGRRIVRAAALRHRIGHKAPSVKGAWKVGRVLRVRQADKALRACFTPAPSRVRFQWLRDGKTIKGATARSYRLHKADRRHRIRLKLIAVRAGHVSGTWLLKAGRVR